MAPKTRASTKRKAAEMAAKVVNSTNSIGLGNNPEDRRARRDNRAGQSMLRQEPVRVFPDHTARACYAQFLVYEKYLKDPESSEHEKSDARRTLVDTFRRRIAMEDNSYPT